MGRLRFLGFAPLFAFVSVSGLAKQPVYTPTRIDDSTKAFGQSELRYIHGIPFLKLAGTDHEMGLAYGVLLREELAEAMGRLQDYRKILSRAIPWYLRPFAGILMRKNLWAMAARLPAGYREELAGIAAGSGQHYEDLVFSAFVPEIFTIGCSSLLKRFGDQVVLARNLDFHPAWFGDYPVVVEYDPRGKKRFTTVGIIGYPGVLTGFNERGLAIALNYAPTGRNISSKDPPIGFKLRSLLESAGTLGEVESLLSGYRNERGWILTVASSAERDGAIFELAGGEMAEHRLGRADHLFVTNFFLNEELRRKYMTIFTANEPGFLARFAQLRTMLDRGAGRDLDGLLDLLANTEFYDFGPCLTSLGLTLNYGITLQSIVIEPGAGRVVFSSAAGFAGFARFYRYDSAGRRVSIYHEENTGAKQKAAGVVTWGERAIMCLITKNYHNLAQMIDLRAAEPNPDQVFLAFVARQLKLCASDREDLSAAVERVINKYPEYAFPYIWQAMLLMEAGDYDGVMGLLENSLALPTASDQTRMLAYYIFAECYRKKKDETRAAEYAGRCCELIQSYAMGRMERKIYKSLSRYAK